MRRHEAAKEVAIEPIQVVDRVANRETRMQIEEQMHIPQWPRKVKQSDVLSRERRKLNS
jgi:hypothetical protein